MADILIRVARPPENRHGRRQGSCVVPKLLLQAQGILAERLPWALHYLTAFGPALSALPPLRGK
jgi:hypothetical protein